jgi:PAS domain S-box-containing protein
VQRPIIHDVWDRWYLPVLTIAVALIVVVPAMLQLQLAATANHTVVSLADSQQVHEAAQGLETALRDVESAAMARSYGVDRPLLQQRGQRGLARISGLLRKLAQMTKDNPEQQLRIGRIQATIERRVEIAGRIAASREPLHTRALIEEMVAGNPIRILLYDLQHEEARILQERSSEALHQRRQYIALSWGALVVQLLLMGTVIWLLQRQIGRRLAAEKEYQKVSARAASVLQTVRDPIVLIDAQQRVILHNPAFAELYGLPAGRGHLLELAHIGAGVWCDDAIQQRLADVLLRGRELWDYEHWQRGADGVARIMLINARRMPLPDGEDKVVLLTISDISLQKSAQQQIQQLNWQLEGKIEQLSEVNAELEAFSYSVSHDLRAPLRHVSGFSSKLSRHLADAGDATTQHYLQVISGSARQMAALIDDLLVYSRLGRSALRMQLVDMQTLVAECRAMLDANAHEEYPGHRIVWDISALPVLVGDENMLRQLWMNLLGNAVKYSSQRDVATIEVVCTTLEDASYQFTVRDNGVGFDMQYVDKLFGVFQRLHKASEYPGTGIGLASVRRVLARHGGRIWAEGMLGEGAVFHFVVPPAHEGSN